MACRLRNFRLAMKMLLGKLSKIKTKMKIFKQKCSSLHNIHNSHNTSWTLTSLAPP